jgi:micrococcal nuclease
MKKVHKGALRILVAVGLSLLVSCSSGATTENEVLITVLKVIDGDTVDIDIKGNTERVRLIGVNTPETKHPTKPIECYGPEASAYLTQLLPKGTHVRIERDIEARDRYGRMLLYLYRESDNLFINLDLVSHGYGTPMSIEPNTFHRNDFVHAAALAETTNVGLWQACR